ncbi:uncharacterized protein L201_007836 [Kwoniella dendrophila CBS 6074]|uniref:NADH:ubiquinone oxidoreductase intermediate-associated protein 30 domain-containing protein n=1 Tax=Kwoniella dendrophila CBS 6074 TaxID=1295534 RepID=A0AAX4K6V9_9TREE
MDNQSTGFGGHPEDCACDFCDDCRAFQASSAALTSLGVPDNYEEQLLSSISQGNAMAATTENSTNLMDLDCYNPEKYAGPFQASSDPRLAIGGRRNDLKNSNATAFWTGPGNLGENYRTMNLSGQTSTSYIYSMKSQGNFPVSGSTLATFMKKKPVSNLYSGTWDCEVQATIPKSDKGAGSQTLDILKLVVPKTDSKHESFRVIHDHWLGKYENDHKINKVGMKLESINGRRYPAELETTVKTFNGTRPATIKTTFTIDPVVAE